MPLCPLRGRPRACSEHQKSSYSSNSGLLSLSERPPPASVIRIRVTSTGLLAAKVRSGVAVASLSLTKPAIRSDAKPCATNSTSVVPAALAREHLHQASPRDDLQVLVEFGDGGFEPQLPARHDPVAPDRQTGSETHCRGEAVAPATPSLRQPAALLRRSGCGLFLCDTAAERIHEVHDILRPWRLTLADTARPACFFLSISTTASS